MRVKRPLVFVSKGVAWSRAEDEERAFIEHVQIPFVRSPMCKWVRMHDGTLSVAAARACRPPECVPPRHGKASAAGASAWGAGSFFKKCPVLAKGVPVKELDAVMAGFEGSPRVPLAYR